MRRSRVGFRLVGRLLPSGQVNTVRIAGEDDCWPPGTELWWLNGRFHREDGPAIIYPDGYEAWFLDGCRHREGGLAIIRPDGTGDYWEHGRRIR